MCAAVRVLVVGKLFSDTLKSIVFDDLFTVITAVPRAVFSTLVIGGTSFSADNCTVNTVISLGLVGVLSSPHPATPTAAITTAITRRFIVSSSEPYLLPLPAHVESHVDFV